MKAIRTVAAVLTAAALLALGINAALPAPKASAAPHKVMVIIDENTSRANAMANMPHLASWASTYGQATNYFAITHPSLPNYLAIWGGDTFGVTTDCSVGASGCVPSPPSVWGQTRAAGGTAKAYQESMTSNCQTGNANNYVARHGPWPYWTDATERGYCNTNDVPMGTTTSGNLLNDINSGNLPVTGEITPNLCDDAHDVCSGHPLTTADNWLNSWVPLLMAGPDYQAGNLTIIITFDEDGGDAGNNVAFVVIDPRLHGTTVTSTFNHYALTKWLDDNAGVSDLRNAASAGDLRGAFGLGGQCAPTVTSFSPTSGQPGDSVTVTGTCFTGATAVKFNGATATFTVNSGTSITATVPAGATTGPISVTGPGGTGTSSTSFTVNPPASQSTTLTPVGDTYVNSTQPDTNHGTSASIITSASVNRGLLKFHTAGAVPSGDVVTGATLSVYTTQNSAASGGYEIHPEADTWAETTVTWNNQPTWNSTVIATSATPPVNTRTVTTLPVGSVNLNGGVDNGNTSFGIRYTLSGTNVIFSSRETANPPQLTISYQPSSLSLPLRAAFYYPWYPETWTQSGIYPATHYTPSLGFYDSSSTNVITQHIAAMRYAHLDAGIASWWGQGTQTDSRVPLLLQQAHGTGFRWSLYYEPEGQGDPSSTQIQGDLTYIYNHYATDPSYLWIGGKPVLFVFADPNDGCGMADRWATANAAEKQPFYLVLKVFPGYTSCASQPSNWHQYGPAVAADEQAGHSYSISPGYWKYSDSTPLLSRDPARWVSNVQAMVASGEPLQLVTTFNEWIEGTAVESATDWASSSGYGTYLDTLNQNIPPR